MPTLTRCLRAAASLTLGLFALAAESLAQSPAPASFVTPKLFYGIEGFRAPPVIDVATGDLNGDGIPDIISVGGLGGASYVIGVLLGNGDGTFQPGTYYQLDNVNPRAVALGDFNRDGHLDAAVLLQGSPGSVAIYLGDGTGNLGTPTLYPVGNTGSSGFNNLAAADVNGDRKLDLVVTNDADSTVSVLLGKGDGTFEPQVAYPTGTQAVNQPGANWVAIADVDKNGKPDLVVACDGDNQALSVLLGNGDGTFQAPLLTPGPYPVNGVAVADLNDDGNPDVVAVSEYRNVAMVFLGNGDGTFQAPAVDFVPGASSVAIANLAGDKKKLDLLVADYNDSTTWVLLGNGDGTFQAGTAYATAPGDQGLAVADFNRDGKLDFVVGAGDADQQGELVTVVLGNGDGTFRASANYGLTYASQILSIAAADFNGDGNLDIVEAGGSPANNAVSVMLGSAHGVLGAPVSAPALCNNPNWVDAGDVNGDGKPDIVASPNCDNPSLVAVLLGKGNGTFQPPVYYPTGDNNAFPYVVKLADTRGNGSLDVLVGNVDGSLSVLLNKGKGRFEAGTVIPAVTGTAETILTGDFNNDGKLDLALPDFVNSAVKILLGQGNGKFDAPIILAAAQGVPAGPQGLAVGDFNHDGKLDLAIDSARLGAGGGIGGGFAVLLGNGDGTFTFSADYGWDSGTNTSPGTIATADVNGDGNLDLLISLSQGGGGMVVYLGNGDGTFTANPGTFPYVGFLAGTNSQQVIAGDFNDDGAIDAAVVENAGCCNSYVTMLINNTPAISVSPLVMSFVPRTVGSKSTSTVLLTNNRPTSLAIEGIGIGGADPGDFTYQSGCAAMLFTGADCKISVTFQPGAMGLRTAVLTITDGAGTQTVSLSGTGK